MAPEGLNPTPEQMGIKPKETRFSDDKGNSMTIEEGAEGATVSAHIETEAPYQGGANPEVAKKYAHEHGLEEKNNQ